MATPAGSFHAPSFGALLRQLRRAAGLSQDDLALKAELSRNEVSELERGRKKLPHRDTVARLAKALDLDEPSTAAFQALARGQQPHPPYLRAVPPRPLLPLVGRHFELEAIEAHLDGTAAPFLCFTGEPGIGKSRLLAEAGQRAQAQGWRVISGGCTRLHGQEPYEPLVSALAQHLRQTPLARQRLELQECAWLVRLLPELLDAHVVPPPSWTLPPQQERRLMFQAVARYLSNSAGPAGTLLLLDDLQWAGEDALALLASLVRGEPGGEQPARVVGAYRATELHLNRALGLLLADLAKDELTHTHALPLLGPEDAVTLFMSLWSNEPDGNPKLPSEQVQDEILRQAEGLPFFLVSSVRALQAGASPDEALQAQGMVGSVRARLALLPEAAHELLGLAAIAGRVVSGALVLATVPFGAEEALDLLDLICQGGLMTEGESDTYRFTHDLIREVVESDLSTRRRRVLHRRLAEEMSRSAAGTVQYGPADIAYHYYAAGEFAMAIPLAMKAGDQAAAASAHHEALDHYRLVIEAARASNLREPEAEAAERMSWEYLHVGRNDDAFAIAVEAASVRQAIGDPDQWALAALHVVQVCHLGARVGEGITRLADLVIALAASSTGQVEQPPANILLSPLAESVPSHLSPLTAAHFHVQLALCLNELHALPEALAAIRRAVSAARRADDIATLNHAQMLHGRISLDIGLLCESEEASLEAARIARERGDLFRLQIAISNTGGVSYERGQLAHAQHLLQEAVKVAELLNNPDFLVTKLINIADNSFLMGNWPEARGYLRRAEAAVKGTGLSVYGLLPQAAWGRQWLVEGETARGIAALEDVLARGAGKFGADVLTYAVTSLADYLLLTGSASRARELLEPFAGRVTSVEDHIGWLLPWAYAETGEPALAEKVLAPLIADAEAQQMRTRLVHLYRVRGTIRLRRADFAEAATSLESSLSLASTLPFPYGEVRALYFYGMLRESTSEPERAHEAYEQALAICERLGEGMYRKHIERALAAL